MSNRLSRPAFAGAREFLEWLYALDRRPWVLTREKLLPIVHLRVGGPAGESRRLLAELQAHWTARRFRGARQCVMVAPSGAADVEQLLAAAAAQFFRERGRGAPRFALACWLADLRRSGRPAPSEEEVFQQLSAYFNRHEIFYEEGPEATGGARIRVSLATISDLPWWIRLPASVLPRMALHAADTLFGPHRWFEHRGEQRRREVRPGEPEPLYGTVHALAERVTETGDEAPTQRQVNALLADALLEDLRRAYGRGGLLGRGRRRRTYPVLLLGCESGEAAALLQAVTDVRNGRPRRGTFKRDPLLLVAAGPRPASEVDPRVRAEAAPGSPETAYADWDGELSDASRRSRVWLLPFAIPGGPPPDTVPDLVRNTRPPRRVPWMSFVGPALLIALLVAVPVSSHRLCRPWWSPSVRVWPPGVLNAMSLQGLGNDGKQCVGLVGEDPPRVPRDLAGPIELIRKANEQAVRDPDHITVVHLTMLSPGNGQGVRAAREELRGLAIAQRDFLQDESPIRVLLANAGANMEFADLAARRIVDAARRDRRIVGVVGLGLSTRQTVDAVRRLGHARLPSVGSATTADALMRASSYYYPIAPGNRRQAAVGARYIARDLHAARARVYASADPDDTYSRELAREMRERLRDAGVTISDEAGYRVGDGGPGEDITQLGRRACKAARKPDEIVVYAGRAERFQPFVAGMRLACQNHYPRILATDDVSRFVLAGSNHRFPGLRLEYMALASSALWGTDCRAAQRQGGFYVAYNDLFGSACDQNRDGRALLTYDALSLVRQAAVNVRAVDPGALKAQGIITGLSGIRGEGRVSGVSGDLDYSDLVEPRTPKDKAILILRATAGPPCLVKVEGKFSLQERIQGDCSPEPAETASTARRP